MKKVLATLLSVILVLSASVTVFGATQKDVKEKTASAASFVDESYKADGYSVTSNLKVFYILVKSGYDVSAYEDDFLASVKSTLDSNGFTSVDNLGPVINILIDLGLDPTNFEGYNLANILTGIPASNCYNAYNLVYAIEAAKALGLNDYANDLAAALLDYYEAGVGTHFWRAYGSDYDTTSADDLAMFIIGLSYVDNENYDVYLSDAFSLLQTYYTEQGYSNYGANADSTALALGAFSVAGNKEKADSVYKLLMDNFYNSENGAYKVPDGYDEGYAASDALYGLALYAPLADEDPVPPINNDDKKDNKNNGNTKAEEKKNTSKKSPATSNSASLAGGLTALSLSALAIIALKKKEN